MQDEISDGRALPLGKGCCGAAVRGKSDEYDIDECRLKKKNRSPEHAVDKKYIQVYTYIMYVDIKKNTKNSTNTALSYTRRTAAMGRAFYSSHQCPFIVVRF